MIMGTKVRLRRKRLSDAYTDYQWQADPELARRDATTPLAVPYSKYLIDYSLEATYALPGRRAFAIETLEGKHIGNCVYYDINEAKHEAELGIMIGDRDYWNKGYGTDAVTALLKYIFTRTKLNRIYLKTLDWNAQAQRGFEKSGFKRYGRMVRDGYDFVLMEIFRKDWEERQKTEEQPEET